MKKFAAIILTSAFVVFTAAGCSANRQVGTSANIAADSQEDENSVASVVTNAGYDPYEKKILGITAMTSLLGKKKFEELLAGFITKPPGKPTLVPDTDKRPAMNTAKDDFIEE